MINEDVLPSSSFLPQFVQAFFKLLIMPIAYVFFLPVEENN